MKSKNILITGMLMLLPSAVLAQQHIQQAFDVLRSSNIKEVSSRHSVEKDPDSDTKPSETWLSEFNTYKNHFLKNTEGAAANSYATQIYKLCKNAKSLEDVEKNIVTTEIVKLKKKTKDDFIQQLFDMSIERLKK